MRAVVIQPDRDWLEGRRQRGADRWDEVWDGVLHVVPAPSTNHQRFESKLEAVLRPLVEPIGLEVFHNLSVYELATGENNYRTPDLLVVDPEHLSKRGVEARAELVIELLSPDDESRDKFPFYASCQIPEVWLIDPNTRAAEVYVLRGTSYLAVAPDRSGTIRTERLGLELQTLAGPKLRIGWASGHAEI